MPGCRQSLTKNCKEFRASSLRPISSGNDLHMHPLRSWLLIAIAITFAPAAFAWGPDGHRTVATLAQKLIAGSNAATQVQALLGNFSLADVAVWADCAKGVNQT